MPYSGNQYTTFDKTCQEVNATILSDKTSTGRERNWSIHKRNSLILAHSLMRIGEQEGDESMKKRSARVRFCADWLDFVVTDEFTGKKVLKNARFCKALLCSMCQWRKSLKVAYNVGQVMNEVERQHPNLKPLFLTLTVRNCTPDRLTEKISALLKAFRRFSVDDTIDGMRRDGVVKGFFRALEITYNEKSDSFHPHIHAILLVDGDTYFKRTNKKYLKSCKGGNLVALWRRALRADYDPIVDIRRVKPETKGKEVAEVAKYALKSSEYLKAYQPVETDRLVKVLSDALHGRRIFAFGGVMKAIAKELKADKPDEGDLIHVDEDGVVVIDEALAVMETYRWDFKLMNYVKTSERRGECQT